MWFEEISLTGFPRKLKSVGRIATAAEEETDQKQCSPPVTLSDLIISAYHTRLCNTKFNVVRFINIHGILHCLQNETN